MRRGDLGLWEKEGGYKIAIPRWIVWFQLRVWLILDLNTNSRISQQQCLQHGTTEARSEDSLDLRHTHHPLPPPQAPRLG